MYVERKTDIDECEVEFSKVLWFNFGVGGRNNSCWHTAKLKKYGLGILMTPWNAKKKSNVHYIPLFPVQLYDGNPLPNTPAKASDLKKLAKDYLPESAMCFYMNIQTLDQWWLTIFIFLLYCKSLLLYKYLKCAWFQTVKIIINHYMNVSVTFLYKL